MSHLLHFSYCLSRDTADTTSSFLINLNGQVEVVSKVVPAESLQRGC